MTTKRTLTYKEYQDPRKHYTIGICNEKKGYGYFENNYTGTEGGLWFEGRLLVDYDGVFFLPEPVINVLLDLGYIIEAEFFPDYLNELH